MRLNDYCNLKGNWHPGRLYWEFLDDSLSGYEKQFLWECGAYWSHHSGNWYLSGNCPHADREIDYSPRNIPNPEERKRLHRHHWLLRGRKAPNPGHMRSGGYEHERSLKSRNISLTGCWWVK